MRLEETMLLEYRDGLARVAGWALLTGARFQSRLEADGVSDRDETWIRAVRVEGGLELAQ